MCTVSMIMDHYRDRWTPMLPQQPTFVPQNPQIIIQQAAPLISAEEVAEFRRLLDRAREYDRRNNEPDCELDEKRQALKRMAVALGIDISFVDKAEPTPAADAVGEASDEPVADNAR